MKENNLELRCEVYLKGFKVEEYTDIPSKKMLEGVLTAVNLYKVCRRAGSFKEFEDIQRLPKQNTVHEGQIFSNKCTRKCMLEVLQIPSQNNISQKNEILKM